MLLLVADDDPSLRTALRLVFEDAGHEVLQASSVHEVRDVLSCRIPDAVLIDAGMSEGGRMLWREMEGDPLHAGRTLLLTGNLPALGALRDHPSVLAKPFDYRALLSRIESLGPRRVRAQGAVDTGVASLTSVAST